ncbi:MAG: hypothetical protein K9K67_02045 [Bacteriovoracaceae bacterium]|nr:hypothetical protein [Bacteriovoracaceae bacterium]
MLKSFIVFVVISCSTSIYALPIDWHGVLGFDTSVLDAYRRVNTNSFTLGNDGSQEVELPTGEALSGSWQSYIFRLQPNIVVNDSATIKAELSSGYARGGFVGDESTLSQASGTANQLYPLNFSTGADGLVVNQLYAEIYSDTATYLLGRHPQHFGLGAVVDSGEDTWDRFSYLRDGITVKVKLGNFKIEPYWTRVNNGTSLTKGTRVKDYGISLVYDSVERDLAFGILYNKKQTTASSLGYTTTVNSATTQSIGATDVKMTDIYFHKAFGDFDFGVEVPILTGEIGNVYTGTTTYKAQAIVLESNFKASSSWSFGLDAGKVNGDDGGQSSFDAMYLNPNYQVANILFRYNLRAIANDGSYNLYDSYINNATYARLRARYSTEKWRWDVAWIYAKADQVAKAGTTAYNHLRNESFTANFNQQDDLGMEFDSGFEYKWNSEITIGGQFGYLLTGDYFGYTNTATKNEVANSYLLQLRAAITF